MTKVNVVLTMTGVVSSIREKDPESKTRKGSEASQNKSIYTVHANGITPTEWTRRFDAAVSMISTGKGVKAAASADKRLKDAEDQIADLTEQLDKAKLRIEELEADMPMEVDFEDEDTGKEKEGE